MNQGLAFPLLATLLAFLSVSEDSQGLRGSKNEYLWGGIRTHAAVASYVLLQAAGVRSPILPASSPILDKWDKAVFCALVDEWRMQQERATVDLSIDKFSMCHVNTPEEKDELFLLSVPAEARGLEEPFRSVVLAFQVPKRALASTALNSIHGIVPLILDLDDTLLLAYSHSSLTRRLHDAMNRRANFQNASVLKTDEAKYVALLSHTIGIRAIEDSIYTRRTLENLREEVASLREDLQYLTEFKDHDKVTLKTPHGETVLHASLECMASGHNRVILRMDASLILIRIDSENWNSSMLIRLRPGWQELRETIAGVRRGPRGEILPQGPPKFKAWISTKAERSYATAAWRLLDPNGELIPADQLEYRMHCVPADCPKKLSQAMRIASGTPVGDAETASTMPYAIIADDNVEVWEASAQKQVVKVERYNPHAHVVDMQEWIQDKRQDPQLFPGTSLLPLRDKLINVRARFFYFFRFGLYLANNPSTNPRGRSLAFPRMKSLAQLIQEDVMEVPLPPSNEELPIFTGRSDLIVRVPEPLSIAPVSEAPQELLKLKEDKPELERLQNIQGKPERAKQPQGQSVLAESPDWLSSEEFFNMTAEQRNEFLKARREKRAAQLRRQRSLRVVKDVEQTDNSTEIGVSKLSLQSKAQPATCAVAEEAEAAKPRLAKSTEAQDTIPTGQQPSFGNLGRAVLKQQENTGKRKFDATASAPLSGRSKGTQLGEAHDYLSKVEWDNLSSQDHRDFCKARKARKMQQHVAVADRAPEAELTADPLGSEPPLKTLCSFGVTHAQDSRSLPLPSSFLPDPKQLETENSQIDEARHASIQVPLARPEAISYNQPAHPNSCAAVGAGSQEHESLRHEAGEEEDVESLTSKAKAKKKYWNTRGRGRGRAGSRGRGRSSTPQATQSATDNSANSRKLRGKWKASRSNFNSNRSRGRH